MAELPKTYDPKIVEPKWYQRWLDTDAFRADAKSTKHAFSIVIPPPNITGVLTLGHVLNNTIQDILARRARMQGHEVMWLPGMDHAGIGTQTAVEKWLRKNEGVTRHDLGREEFLRRVLEWQDKHGGIIIQQLKRLGCSCDWSRQRYTFGADYIQAVEKVFVDLYQKGLIYRGRRMINWDPAAQTALSDEEVISKPQKGSLYFVRYEVVDEPGRFLEVATTRPETIMADTAVAVHPNDKRYTDLVGKQVWRPLAREKLPIIADEAIDPEFGTGVLKVTPAHDKVDFEVGQRHKLPIERLSDMLALGSSPVQFRAQLADPAARAGTISVKRYDYNSLRLTVNAPTAGYVYVADGFARGWRARVDGRPSPVLRANMAFKAVGVGAGKHEIRLEYRPVAFQFALWAYAAAVALGSGGLVIAWFRQRN